MLGRPDGLRYEPPTEEQPVLGRPDGLRYEPPTGHNHAGDNHSHHGHNTPSHRIRCGGGYRWDSAALIIYDSFGHGYNNYHSQCFHNDSIFIVPHFDDRFHGTYHCHGGVYYYHPQTYATVGVQYVAQEPVVIQFGGYSNCMDLASRLEVHCNSLCLDLYHNYQHVDEFREYYSACFQLLDAARFIGANRDTTYYVEYGQYLQDMDYAMWQLQELSAAWERREVRKVSEAAIETQFGQANAMLQHLLYDVGIESNVAETAAQEEFAPEELEFAPSPDQLFGEGVDG